MDPPAASGPPPTGGKANGHGGGFPLGGGGGGASNRNFAPHDQQHFASEPHHRRSGGPGGSAAPGGHLTGPGDRGPYGSSNTGGGGGGPSNAGPGAYNSGHRFANAIQHPMQFNSSNNQYGGFYRNANDSGGPRRPRTSYRSNREWHGGHSSSSQQQQSSNQGSTFGHTDYDVWPNGGMNAATSPVPQSQEGATSPHQQHSPGHGRQVTFSTRPTVYPIPPEKLAFEQKHAFKPKLAFKKKLKDLCEKQKLPPPEYTTIAAKETKYRSSDFFGCCSIAGERKPWKTSPNYYPTKEEAEQRAAKQAYFSLYNKYRPSASAEEVHEADNIITDRVKKILRKNKTSYIDEGVEAEYRKKYNVELPPNWIDIVTSMCDDIKVEKQQFTNKTITLLTYTEVLIPFFELTEEENKDQFVQVRILTVNSPSSFWVHRSKGEEMERLEDEMATFYDSPENPDVVPLTKFSKGTLAAFKHSAGWSRFQVKELVRPKSKQPTKAKKAKSPSKEEKSPEKEEKNPEKEVESPAKEETSHEKEESPAKDDEPVKSGEASTETAKTEKSPEKSTDAGEKVEDEKVEGEKVDGDQAEGGSKSTEASASANSENANNENNEPAEINEEPVGEKVIGYFVDFGTKSDLSTEEMKVLNDQFKLLPKQAVECSLSGIKSASAPGWSDEAKKFFSERILNKFFVIKVHSIERGRLIVDLFDTTVEPDVNIAQELLAKNFAIESGP